MPVNNQSNTRQDTELEEESSYTFSIPKANIGIELHPGDILEVINVTDTSYQVQRLDIAPEEQELSDATKEAELRKMLE